MPISSPNAKDPTLVAFGSAIRRARKKSNVAQEELANLCGVDRSYLGAIERGEQNPGLLHIVRIAGALRTSVAEMMSSAGL